MMNNYNMVPSKNIMDCCDAFHKFCDAFHKLYKRYLEIGVKAIFIDGTVETPEFRVYEKCVREVIRIHMNSERLNDNGTPSNKMMVSSLREFAFYNYSNHFSNNDVDSDDSELGYDFSSASNAEFDSEVKIDDLLDHLLTKIITTDALTQYYLKKADPSHALNSIMKTVTNELRDRSKAIRYSIPLPKPLKSRTSNSSMNSRFKVITNLDNCSSEDDNELVQDRKNSFCMISLDSTINDEEGNSTSFGTVVADPRHNIEEEVIRREMLNYGVNTFVHEAIKLFVESETPYYLLTYLNTIAGSLLEKNNRTVKHLAREITCLGFDNTLNKLITIICHSHIDISYLRGQSIDWHLEKNDFKENDIYKWQNNSERITHILYRKMAG